MRRIDWTETMLSRLAELYPVETTAHTAYMLQIGVTAVKEKARELGLEKLAKSRWLERAGHISRHFDNRSYAEMAGDLGVSRTTVSRMARKLGLSRSKAKGYAMSSRVRNELVRR
ncbi:MarR family transcriptional regulator, partial [Marseilla massiliensis]|nr:MarR family transcriptional regulator [Marseilla massiliensis]